MRWPFAIMMSILFAEAGVMCWTFDSFEPLWCFMLLGLVFGAVEFVLQDTES